MIEYKVELLEKQLRELRRITPSGIGSLILSAEGLPVAADLPTSLEEEWLAARSAAILGLGERISAELRRGKLEQVFINGREGCVIFALINDETTLTVLYDTDVRVAMAMLDIAYSVNQLRQLLR
ncbi:MAG: roadblock/LC7 domain-containing protein [Ardenticatenales bacterium]|nr:roadblock/LC7 domain-containing protein [Ardenticatenales bacterium]